ncbi:MAG: hypothetical protein ACR2OU_19665 [Thermomicrobiales bacterium]
MKRMTFSDIVSVLGQSEANLRVLANEFVLFIPATRIGEDCFFRPEALEVFQLIINQIEVGVRREYIEIMLSRRYPLAEISVFAAAGLPAVDAFSGASGHLSPALTNPLQVSDQSSLFQAQSRAVLYEPAAPRASSSLDEMYRRGGSLDQATEGIAGRDRLEAIDQDVRLPPDPEQPDLLRQKIDYLERRLRDLESQPPASHNHPLEDNHQDVSPKAVDPLGDTAVSRSRGFDGLANRMIPWLSESAQR